MTTPDPARREALIALIRERVSYSPHPWDIARPGDIVGIPDAADAILAKEAEALAEARARVESLEAGINAAIRRLSDSDEHEFTRILAARDVLILTRDAPLRAVLSDTLAGARP